jgi:hypothetical protein
MDLKKHGPILQSLAILLEFSIKETKGAHARTSVADYTSQGYQASCKVRINRDAIARLLEPDTPPSELLI